MPRIVAFSPYTSRYHLFAYEATILKACQIRGADVEYLLCDGLLPQCDQYWKSFPDSTGRPSDICRTCQAKAKRNLREVDTPLKALPYRWLSEFVPESERTRAL